MTAQLWELGTLPSRLVLDGELVAFGADGLPSFALLCERMLHRRRDIPIVLMIFDVLRVGGDDVAGLPYRARRRVLEELDLRGDAWHTPAVYQDGDALYHLVCERGLRASSVSRCGARTAQASVGGSRSRTAATGATRSRWRRHDGPGVRIVRSRDALRQRREPRSDREPAWGGDWHVPEQAAGHVAAVRCRHPPGVVARVGLSHIIQAAVAALCWPLRTGDRIFQAGDQRLACVLGATSARQAAAAVRRIPLQGSTSDPWNVLCQHDVRLLAAVASPLAGVGAAETPAAAEQALTWLGESLARYGDASRVQAMTAIIDGLTGVAAHRLLTSLVDRTAPVGAAVIYLDVVAMKQINDDYGMRTGDTALRRVGETIAAIASGTAARRPASAATSSCSCSSERRSRRHGDWSTRSSVAWPRWSST
jgi:hypothetical protein